MLRTECSAGRRVHRQRPLCGRLSRPDCGNTAIRAARAKNIFIYGTLSKPVTAREASHIKSFIKHSHPGSKVIAIDAAVGNADDVGLIKILPFGLKPGSGAAKNLARIGDISVMGVVAEKSPFNYALFSATRLSMVYKMAEIISLSCSFI